MLISRHKAVGHVNQGNPGLGQYCQRTNMRENGLISRTVFQRNEYVFIQGGSSRLRSAQPFEHRLDEQVAV